MGFSSGLFPHRREAAMDMSWISPRCAPPQSSIAGAPACATCTTARTLEGCPFRAGGWDGEGQQEHGKGCDPQSIGTNLLAK